MYVDSIALFTTGGSATALNIANTTTGLGQMNVESTTTFNSGLSGLQGVIVKGFSGQTASLQDWQNSGGVALVSVAANGLVNAATGGLATFTKAGTGISDTDFTNPVNGLLAVDTADNALYVRAGGTWHTVGFTAGFQIPSEESSGIGPEDLLMPYVEKTMDDGAVHGLYAKFSDVKDQLFASEEAQLANLANLANSSNLTNMTNSVIFHKDIAFEGTPTFNSDRAGEAIISKDSSSVAVQFAHPYETTPVVTFSLVLPSSSSATFLDEGHRAYLSDTSKNGFSIVLPDLAIHDYLYHWTAFEVSDMTTTRSATLSN